MEIKFVRIRVSFILFIFSIGLAIGGQTWAQSISLDYEKAALVNKFAKYVSWPAEARQRKFIIGVYEDFEKYQYFRDYFANKRIKGKDISVRLVKAFGQAKNVHILYITKLNQRNLSSLTDRIIRNANVLIITEDSKDITKTMIDLSYNKEQSKIDFQVIDQNIIAANLAMPELSYFLDDNDDVINNDNESESKPEINNEGFETSSDEGTDEIVSEKPDLTLKNDYEKQLQALKSQLSIKQSALAQLNKQLNLSEENLEKYNLALQEKSARLAIEEQENTKQSQAIKSKDKTLKALEKQLKAQQVQLKMSQQVNAESNQTLIGEHIPAEEKTEPAQEHAFADLTAQLKQQTEIANNAVLKLSKITKDNSALSSFKSLFYIFLLIAVIALLIAYLMWKKAKGAAKRHALPAQNDHNTQLPMREGQLIQSENFAALGYIATDITYAVGLTLDELQVQLEAAGDTQYAATLKPVVTLLNNFNLIAADQDDAEIRSFDLTAYIQKMVMLYEFEFNQSDIVYTYAGENSLTIKSVPSYIALVLLNLINNSLKHGFDNNGNGQIALKVEKGLKHGAKITYSDNGKGMKKAVLDKVFEPFFTTQSSRGYVGVGMSTSYDIIKNKLAGDIQIASTEGKGTTVTITLP